VLVAADVSIFTSLFFERSPHQLALLNCEDLVRLNLEVVYNSGASLDVGELRDIEAGFSPGASVQVASIIGLKR
jgi:hypothetical protein